MKRQVWLLFFCSALMHASIVGQAVMAALIGHSLAEDKTLSTLPVAIQMTATMAASIPAGIVFTRLGRRAGFTMGAVAALLGSLTFAAGVWRGSFPCYCLGAVSRAWASASASTTASPRPRWRRWSTGRAPYRW